MEWRRIASGLFAAKPVDIEGPARVVVGLSSIVALMKEGSDEQFIVLTNVAGGSGVSTIIQRAKAIVSTIGGANSHIVVVARDHGTPCIVGAEGLDLQSVPSGAHMRLRRNGDVEIFQ